MTNIISVVQTITALRGISGVTDGDAMVVDGYNTEGDGGGGLFYWNATSVAADDNGTIIKPTGVTTGRWYRPYSGYLNPKWFGAYGDSSHDDTGAFKSLIAVAAGGGIFIPAGTYTINSELNFTGVTVVEGEGRDVVTLDFSAATGSFPDNAAFYVSGPALVGLQSLSKDPAAGDTTLTFTSAPSISIGDVINIYNPTNGSYSNFRAYYREGEMCRVTGTGSVVSISSPLYSKYVASGVSCYKMPVTKFSCRGFSVVGNASGMTNIAAIQLKRITSGSLSDIRASNTNYAALSISMCHEIRGGQRCVFNQTSVGDGGNQYGLTIDNSQNVFMDGVIAIANRSAFSTGGADVTGGIPVRNVCMTNLHAETLGNVSSVGAVNLHGNTEYCSIHGTSMGAVMPAGNHNEYGCNVLISFAAGGNAYYFSELSGCDHKVRGKIVAYGNPTLSNLGVVDIGGNSNAFTLNTKGDGEFNFDGLSITAPNVTGAVMLISNRGSTRTWDISIKGMKFNTPLCASAALNSQAVSGNPARILYAADAAFSGPTLPPASIPLATVDTATLLDGFKCGGTEALIATNGNTYATKLVSFPRYFPRSPRISVSNQTLYGGTDKYVISGGAPGVDRTTLAVAPVGASFGSTQTLYFDWKAELNDAI